MFGMLLKCPTAVLQRCHCAVADNTTPIFIRLTFAEDEVYMAEESDLQEYILNENGGIWVGSHRQNRPMRWDYGQVSTRES